MAAARWRLRRIEAMEAALFKKAIKQHEEAGTPDAHDAAYVEVAESKSYRMLVRHASQLRRAFEKAWKETSAHSEQTAKSTKKTNYKTNPAIAFLKRQLDAVMTMPLPGARHAVTVSGPQLRS